MSSSIDGVAVLPEGTNLIHIGPQKTGSSAVQKALFQTRDELRSHGVVWPGGRVHPHVEPLGFHARRGAPARPPQAWTDLLQEIDDAAALRVCVSHEVFGRATDEQIPRIVEALGGDRPHVIAVARRYDRYLPSQWQQRVKGRQTRSYEKWLRIVLSESSDAGAWSNVWVPHNTVRLVERWSDHVGLENFTLVVGDESDRRFLPSVFEGLLGLPDGMLDVATKVANRSLSFPEVEMVRRLIITMQERGASEVEFFELLRMGVYQHLVQLPYPEGEPRIPGLPSWAQQRVVELSDQRLAGLRALRERGLRVIGDLETLRVEPDPSAPDRIDAPDTIPIETAVRALDGLARGAEHLRKRTVKEQKARQRAARQRRRARAQQAPPPSLARRVLRRVARR